MGNDAIEDRLVDQAAIEVVEKTRGRQWRPNYKPAVLTKKLPRTWTASCRNRTCADVSRVGTRVPGPTAAIADG